MLFLQPSLAQFIAIAIALVAGISIHEFAHAWTADRLGDPTARNLGRLTLNPLRHLDPLGTIMILLAGFGWGKPVPVNPYRLRTSPAQGMAIVALAGPVSNVLLAILLALPLRLEVVDASLFSLRGVVPSLGAILVTSVLLNVLLAVFNLLPLAPLDGFKIATGLLPPRYAMSFARLEPYGPMILLGLIVVDRTFRTGLLASLMNPFIRGLLRVIVG